MKIVNNVLLANHVALNAYYMRVSRASVCREYPQPAYDAQFPPYTFTHVKISLILW